MTLTTLAGIKKLVAPYMDESTLDIRPSADDGLHLVGYDKHNVWHEFTCVSQALNFANSELYRKTHPDDARNKAHAIS